MGCIDIVFAIADLTCWIVSFYYEETMNSKNKKNHKSEDKSKDLDFLKIQYQVLSNRQISHNGMMWNTPSLLFVAQSLLWTIALSAEIHLIMRCLMSLISSIMGFMSLQLFQRYRLMEIIDSEQLYSIEKLFAQSNNEKPAVIIHQQIDKRTLISENGSMSIMETLQKQDFFSKGHLVHMKSFKLWLVAFWMIFGLSIVISLYNIYELITAYQILNFIKIKG